MGVCLMSLPSSRNLERAVLEAADPQRRYLARPLLDLNDEAARLLKAPSAFFCCNTSSPGPFLKR